MPSGQVAAAAAVAAPTHDSGGRGGAEGLSQLAHAVLCGKLPLVAELLSAPGSDVNAQDTQGRTPLLLASYQGWLDGILLLLEHGAEKNIKDRNGRLPLHAVTYSQSVSALAAIADGSGKAELNAVDNEVMTALHWAAFHGRPGILTQLLDYNVDAFAFDVDRKTALHWAAQNNCVACVDILLRHESAGEKLLGMRDVGGKTALHCAAAAGSVDAIRRLSQSKQCDVNSKDNEKRTPLHWSAGIGRKEAVGLLLELNADPLVVDSCGKAPLDYATDAGHTECSAAMEHWIRRKVIESTTKKWSQKIEAAQAMAKAAETLSARQPTANGRIQQQEKMAANLSGSSGSVSSVQRLLGDRGDASESRWSVNLSTLSLKDDAIVKAEVDLWSRLSALDIANPNTTFLRQPKGAVDRRRLAPLRVSHQNLAFVASHGQGLDGSLPSSSGSLSTLNSLLAPDQRQAGDDDDEHIQHPKKTQQQDGKAQKRGTRARGREAGNCDKGAVLTPAASAVLVGDDISWPSVDSLTGKQTNVQRGKQEHNQLAGEMELSRLKQPEAVTAGISGSGPRDYLHTNDATVDANGSEVSSQDKAKKKVSRVKRKIYPFFERAQDKLWTQEDPVEILKYISEATDSTNL